MGFVGRKPTNAPLTSSDLGTGIVGSTNIADGTITNDDINASAAIASSKLSITSPLSITGNSTAGSEIRLPEDTDNGSNYVALKAADSIASNLTFTLPSADGSANQALITNGSGSLSFATVGATAGQVIQVLSATDSTKRTTSSTSFVTASNTLSVTITPSSASNKIFIMVNTGAWAQSSADSTCIGTIYRGATNLALASGSDAFGVGAAGIGPLGIDGRGILSMSFLDSPATTSATTYQVYFKSDVSNASINETNNASSTTGSITVMEIKG